MSQLFAAGSSAYPLEPQPEPSAVPYPRCRRQADGVYNKLYLGPQRSPRYADEYGAACVIELLCADGERLLLYSIPGDREWMRVASLPARAR